MPGYDFHISEHAKQRFKERHGEGDLLTILKHSRTASKSDRKKINRQCPKHGYQPHCEYYVNTYDFAPRRLCFVGRIVGLRVKIFTFFPLDPLKPRQPSNEETRG